jgi:hypothetical protein
LNGVQIHKSLSTRDWQKAQEIVREWEADGEVTAEQGKGEELTMRASISDL